jgi:CRISPR-associated protein Cas5h
VSRKSTSEERQRNIYEVLTKPKYTIWVALENKNFYNKLKNHLKSGTSYYTPTMGKSEYIADIDYLGEFDVSETDTSEVETVVPIDEANTNQNLAVERVPAYNTSNDDGRGRELGGAITLAYESSGGLTSVDTGETHMLTSENKSSYVRFI